MNLSDAILRGMERFPMQARGNWFDRNSACAMGCALWAIGGDAVISNPDSRAAAWLKFERAYQKFVDSFGEQIAWLNDKGIPREDIAGMLKAIGE